MWLKFELIYWKLQVCLSMNLLPPGITELNTFHVSFPIYSNVFAILQHLLQIKRIKLRGTQILAMKLSGEKTFMGILAYWVEILHEEVETYSVIET